MRILLLTVAGLSSRFSSSVGYPCVKCLYNNGSFNDSLISGMLARHALFDRMIIVGGYEFERLKSEVCSNCPELLDKLIFKENKMYADHGSGYSLYVGLQALKEMYCDELVFAEGDLFVDDVSFEKVCSSSKNVMTYNLEPILADRSVAFYFDTEKRPHYIYDTNHGCLEVNEAFLSLYNSGQIWKFSDINLIERLLNEMDEDMFKGTNLVFVNSYFQNKGLSEIELIGFKKWVNCNTVEDYNKAMEEKYERA